MLDAIESILRKGKNLDQTLACNLLGIFVFHFDFEYTTTFYARFLPFLEPVIRDKSVSCSFRTAAVTTLAVLQAFSGYCDFVLMLDIMKVYESIFKSAGMKQDGKASVFDESINSLHVAALRGWTFLYSFLSRFDINLVGQNMLSMMSNLLQASNVDFRITAGETCAIIYERLRTDFDANFKGPHYKRLLELLKELSVDGSKSFTKIDRKKQRCLFRDIFDTVATNTYFQSSVNFGQENILLSNNIERFRYNFICSIFSGGLQIHLRDNICLRNLFGLGPPIQIVCSNVFDRRLARDQRKLENCIASKQRTKFMSNVRDKRNDMLNTIN